MRGNRVSLFHNIAQVVHAFEQTNLAEGVNVKTELLAVGQGYGLAG